MKLHVKKIALLAMIFATIIFTGCEKADKDTLYGYSLIYIPQATVSQGQNLHYLVPTGFDKNTFNFKVDTLGNTVNVLLGVTRSGLETYDAFTVNVETRTDTINSLIANNLIDITKPTVPVPVELLPSTAYSLPLTVSVPAGKNETSFYLAINMATLKTYAGKKVAMCVVISNPTKYKLSPIFKQVIVLINVDALKLP